MLTLVSDATSIDPVLVTGAGGFIGSAVTRLLAEAGVQVRAHLGPPGATTIPPPAGLDAISADIDDLDGVRSLVDGVTTIVHLAGPASVAASFSDPIGYARAHVVGTATLLEACRGSEVRTLVHVSSAELYGRPDRNPVREDDPLRPRSPYGAVKLGAESLVRSLAPVLGIRSVALRPFSVYGPGGPRRSLVGTLLEQAVHAEEVLLGDLRPVRDYCFVDDVATAVARACSSDAGVGDVFNVGSGVGTSVEDLARLALSVVGRDVPIRTGVPDRPAGVDVSELVADVSAIRRELGWTAATSLRDGLSRTIATGEVGHR